jgi:nicotinamidase-related amidase
MTMNTVIEDWNAVDVPPAPELKPVSIQTEKTALLVLDIQKNNCNADRRPRCVETISGIRRLIEAARSKNVPVVYSLTSKAEPADILDAVAPFPEENIVKSSVDKFFGTSLEDIVNQAGVETVVIVGTAAEGAVLHTATGAAIRGLNVIVPVDGMSSSNLYAEQYTAWHLANSPGTKKRTTLTRMDMISF